MNQFWRALRAFLALQLCLYYGFAQGLDVDLGSAQSIKDASRQLANSMMSFYKGDKPGGTPGLLPGDSNWWEAGAMFGQMVEYWYYTGDTTYNDVTKQALLFQVGPNNAYEPTNQTRVEGNDDQAFWAFAAMSAAELKFPDPDPKQPQWLALAQAVFNNQAHRWDNAHCGGGLRWQFNPVNTGWNLKNAISNGCFFQLAARLARYTKNETYAQWANKAYDWMAQSPIITDKYEVCDGIHFSETSCDKTISPCIQWSYNIGTIMAGASFMYNYTTGAERETWKKRLNGYLNNTQQVFFPEQYGGKTMVEWACESSASTVECNPDQRTFKAYLSRWLAVTAQLAPFSTGVIMPWLQSSATAAMKACSGGPPGGLACGQKWYVDKDDGKRDIGNQMTAMSVVQSNLIQQMSAPVDFKTGTSIGNAAAGSIDPPQLTPDDIIATRTITAGDKAGAWVLTAVLFVMVTCGGGWMVSDRDLGAKTAWYSRRAGFR